MPPLLGLVNPLMAAGPQPGMPPPDPRNPLYMPPAALLGAAAAAGGGPPPMPGPPRGIPGGINPLLAQMAMRRAAGPPPMPAVPPDGPPVLDPSHISLRVPVPKTDFPEAEHQALHDTMMGADFDSEHGHSYVKGVYNHMRKLHPELPPRDLLETTRDAYYAIKHGWMSPQHVGMGLAEMTRARGRKRADSEKKER